MDGGASYHNSHDEGHPAAPGMMGYNQDYAEGNDMDGKIGLIKIEMLGMYENDQYGEEIEQGDDKNDGLNALVRKDLGL